MIPTADQKTPNTAQVHKRSTAATAEQQQQYQNPSVPSPGPPRSNVPPMPASQRSFLPGVHGWMDTDRLDSSPSLFLSPGGPCKKRTPRDKARLCMMGMRNRAGCSNKQRPEQNASLPAHGEIREPATTRIRATATNAPRLQQRDERLPTPPTYPPGLPTLPPPRLPE